LLFGLTGIASGYAIAVTIMRVPVLFSMAEAGFIIGLAYIGVLALTPAGRDLFHDFRRVVHETLPSKKKPTPETSSQASR
jgi:hypothetical protein